MNAMHLPVLPVALPLLAGAAMLLARGRARVQGLLEGLSLLSLAGVAAWLVLRTLDGSVLVALMGDWAVPQGIALVADRLSATMLALVAVLGAAAALGAGASGLSAASPHFRPLLQFQLAGLNGAFLTGDLFNLFVFFEVLLAASYGLLLAGAPRAERPGAALRYVAVNLLASALFLVGASLLYALTGTLNMADLAARAAQVPAADRGLLEAAGLLLLVVFAVKAALVPLNLWLPGTYAVAEAPVAALFAIMTKVGVYAILRVHGTVFGAAGGDSAGLALPAILVAGLLTTGMAAAGVLAARTLPRMGAWFITGSSGMLLAAVGMDRAGVTAGALFYLLESTLAGAAFFLLGARIARARPVFGDRILPGDAPASTALPLAFLLCGLLLAGLPPLAGFLAKFMMLSAVVDGAPPGAGWLVAAQLGFGLAGVIALSRAGSIVFWNGGDPSAGQAADGTRTVDTDGVSTAVVGTGDAGRRVAGTGAAGTDAGTGPAGQAPSSPWREGRFAAAIVLPLGLALAQAVVAAPLARHLSATADALHRPAEYLRAVLDARPVHDVARDAGTTEGETH